MSLQNFFLYNYSFDHATHEKKSNWGYESCPCFTWNSELRQGEESENCWSEGGGSPFLIDTLAACPSSMVSSEQTCPLEPPISVILRSSLPGCDAEGSMAPTFSTVHAGVLHCSSANKLGPLDCIRAFTEMSQEFSHWLDVKGIERLICTVPLTAFGISGLQEEFVDTGVGFTKSSGVLMPSSTPGKDGSLEHWCSRGVLYVFSPCP